MIKIAYTFFYKMENLNHILEADFFKAVAHRIDLEKNFYDSDADSFL